MRKSKVETEMRWRATDPVPRLAQTSLGFATRFRQRSCGPPVYAFGFAEARTAADPPEEPYSESMGVFRRAGLRPGRVNRGRVNRMSKDGGNQTLHFLGEDLGRITDLDPYL
jgi:hypothetical protein